MAGLGAVCQLQRFRQWHGGHLGPDYRRRQMYYITPNGDYKQVYYRAQDVAHANWHDESAMTAPPMAAMIMLASTDTRSTACNATYPTVPADDGHRHSLYPRLHLRQPDFLLGAVPCRCISRRLK